MRLTHLSLFSGIEGIGLAAEAAGFVTVACCEADPFARSVIRQHWPDRHIWWDVRHVTRRKVIKLLYKRGWLRRDPAYGPLIDLLSGGFPCQPFSLAGRRHGQHDDRYLWPEMHRISGELNPRWLLGENVRGLLSIDAGRIFGAILRDMATLGYRVGWAVYGANAIGAPHRRNRVFLLAHTNAGHAHPGAIPARWTATAGRGADVANSQGCSQRTRLRPQPAQPIRWRRFGNGGSQGSGGQRVGDASGVLRRHQRRARATAATESRLGGIPDGLPAWLDGSRWPARPGETQAEWEPPRSGRKLPNRPRRLKALGMAVVPAQVFPLLWAIRQSEEMSWPCRERTGPLPLGTGGD